MVPPKLPKLLDYAGRTLPLDITKATAAWASGVQDVLRSLRSTELPALDVRVDTLEAKYPPRGELTCFLASLLAGTYYFPLPDRPITITRLASTINQALAAADLTITPSINTTPITNGVITVTQAGSAAGDLDEAIPTLTNNTAGNNDKLVLVLAGNTAAGTGAVLVEFTW